MNRRGLAAFIIVTVLVAVVPSWGASLTQTLEGGDTLAVTCNGLRLDQVRNNPTMRTLTCVPNTTTTSTTTTAPTSSTSTTAPPTTAPTTTTPGTTVLYSNTFDTFADMGRVRFQKIGNVSGVSFLGDHDLSCGSPSTYRPLNDAGGANPADPSSLVYWCNGHFMTSDNTISYQEIAMSPTNNGQVMVFPAAANRFCWHQDLAEHGDRKWTELAVVSDDRLAANGNNLAYWNPDFNGNSVNESIFLQGDDFMFMSVGTQFFRGQAGTFVDFTQTPESLTDKMSRYQHCIVDNGNGTTTFSHAMLDGSVYSITGPGSFPAGPKAFVLIDVTYDPDKDGSTKVVQPHTMHWDNLTVTSGTAAPAASI